MHVLDPMEVARVQVWPFWDLEGVPLDVKRPRLNAAEYTVFELLSQESRVSKLLNEAAPTPVDRIELPASYSGAIISAELQTRLGHADERIARRAATMANLAQVVRERDVSLGLRQTLVTQAERLQNLARRRFDEVVGQTPPEQVEEETRHEGPDDV